MENAPHIPFQFIGLENGKLTLNREVLNAQWAFLDPSYELKIISINGPLRTGKSTIMNSIANSLDGDIKSFTTRKNGFHVQSGYQPDTVGMWMWIKKDPSLKCYYLLIDTQGIFDSSIDQMVTTALVSYSTLISSFQIYNLDKQIQEDDMQHLELFTEYAKSASRQPFQSVCFVVRDWQHYSKPNDLKECDNDAFLYFWDRLSPERPGITDASIRLRLTIGKCYQETSGYCLPHPGIEFSQTGTGEVSNEFKIHVDRCTDKVLSQVKSKTLSGTPLHVANFLPFMENSFNALMKHEGMPEPKTLLEVTIDAVYSDLRYTVMDEYRKLFSKLVGDLSYPTEEGWNGCHREAMKGADTRLNAHLHLGSDQQKIKLRFDIHTEMEQYLDAYKTEQRRVNRLSMFTLLVVFGMICGMVSHLSYNFCTLDSCVSISQYSYGVFWLALIAIVVKLAFRFGAFQKVEVEHSMV